MLPGASRQSLDGLPAEMLQQIAARIEHRPSLYAFSLANKTCHGASTRSIFHDIYLTVQDPKALQRSVDSLLGTLSRTDSARHVQRLHIKGTLRIDSKESVLRALLKRHVPFIKTSSDDFEQETVTYYKRVGLDEIFPDEEPVTTFYSHYCYSKRVIERGSQEDTAWAPVAQLLSTLPGLCTLVYKCSNQFAPVLLDALHAHPRCNLHHLTLRFRSLRADTPHAHEMALATSPRLYKIKVRCTERDSTNLDDYNQEAVMDLVAGLAPNLQEVEMVKLYAFRCSRLWERSFHQPCAPWRGLPRPPGVELGIGSLTSLSIGGMQWAFSPELLQAWAEHTDFRCLRHLVLGGTAEYNEQGIAEDILDWIAQNCSFPRVKTARVRLDRRDSMEERPHFADTAVTFLKAFEPLEELAIYGSMEPRIFDVIPARHGPALRKLVLRPSESDSIIENGLPPTQRKIPMVLEREHIEQIQKSCPVLRELMIPVKRTKGDAREVEIYKLLGRMERLTSLFLILECSNWRIVRDSTWTYDPSWNDFDCEGIKYDDHTKKGHVREAFENCAVDEMLARSMWKTITRGEVGATASSDTCNSATPQSPTSKPISPLQKLVLWPRGACCFGDSHGPTGDIQAIIDNLSRSWQITLTHRDTQEVQVRELARSARETRDAELTERYEEKGEREMTDGELVLRASRAMTRPGK